jgi:hypothetical protein
MAIPYGRGGPPSAPYDQKRAFGHPDGQRAFGHPLPSAYGREWLPLAIGAKEGGGGALLTLCPKERLASPMAIPLREGRPFGLRERAAGPSLRP